ncbi:inositol monophosphatase family protein [Afipia carboxidovorans OM5]|uniref:Histidinol-phosphatase n=1 Tax=Afipia carboxidovorans (strain ATCC 49405 / DSM 1227 / KCTC 32145 / OM5) TaxID=504832 RepID=B6JB10_AFIC5|nr:histidinol-phosphatase [Afipia carboxidovorans]ACI92084.1 inositol monophosphatase family protein [Afipia carboxidovorans OM5]AEI04063.1 inositol monophosphatase family protein [Afipia carboxidovorans OM4]AEI07693.1 inositol monophosphatase family protein [Afipia carboxidovorans OM5]
MTVIDFTAFIERLASASGEAIMPFFRTSLGIDNKNTGRDLDPVTEADRGAEAVMRRMIKENFPQHGIIGEEFGSERPDAEYVWVLDPIDGTKSFISGMPVWGTLIALMRHGVPAYGMMHQPYIGERFSGDNGAAFYQGRTGRRKLGTRRCASLADATLFTTSPRLMNEADRAKFAKVEEEVRLSRYGGDCYAYCMLAAGHLDLVIETELKPHDVAALIPIVHGAGGIMTTWEGGGPERGGRIVASGDKRLHDTVLKMLTA